jgi:uncharacterized membrane protein YdjX (TVP38/TMEM64 family)
MINQIIQDFKIFIENNEALAPLYLILAKIVATILFVPGAILTLLSGALLGTFWGSVVSIIGNTIGATLAFLISRYLFRDFVSQKLLSKYKKIGEYEELFFKSGFKTIIFLRLIPIFPFNALNYLLGVTRVSFKDYFWGTFIGIIPGTIAFVYFGESIKMLSWLNILVSICAIIGLSYIGKFWKIK